MQIYVKKLYMISKVLFLIFVMLKVYNLTITICKNIIKLPMEKMIHNFIYISIKFIYPSKRIRIPLNLLFFTYT